MHRILQKIHWKHLSLWNWFFCLRVGFYLFIWHRLWATFSTKTRHSQLITVSFVKPVLDVVSIAWIGQEVKYRRRRGSNSRSSYLALETSPLTSASRKYHSWLGISFAYVCVINKLKQHAYFKFYNLRQLLYIQHGFIVNISTL